MTWRTFTKAIRDSKINKSVQVEIISDLFKKAGCVAEPERSTINSWIYEKRNCDARRYFPNKTIHNKDVFDYFRRRPDNKLRHLQGLFREGTSSDSDSPIDLETENLDVFCWGLVNQFLDLLGFQRIDIPYAAPSGDETVGNGQPLNSQKAESESKSLDPKQGTEPPDEPEQPDTAEQHFDVGEEQPAVPEQPDTAELFEVETIPNEVTASDLSLSGGVAIPIEGRCSIRSSILPHSDSDCCYYCTYWEGDKKTFGAYTTATYGVCTMYNRREQLSSSPACKHYKKHKKMPGEW